MTYKTAGPGNLLKQKKQTSFRTVNSAISQKRFTESFKEVNEKQVELISSVLKNLKWLSNYERETLPNNGHTWKCRILQNIDGTPFEFQHLLEICLEKEEGLDYNNVNLDLTSEDRCTDEESAQALELYDMITHKMSESFFAFRSSRIYVNR